MFLISLQTFFLNLPFQTGVREEGRELRPQTQRLLLQQLLQVQPVGLQLQVPEDGPLPEMGLSRARFGDHQRGAPPSRRRVLEVSR